MFSLFAPKTLHDITKHILYFSKIVSTAPYTIQPDGSVIIHKKLKWLEFFTYLTFITAEIFMQIYWVPTNMKRSAYEWLGGFSTVLFITTNIVNCFQMMAKHKAIIKIIKEITIINDLVKNKNEDLKFLWLKALLGMLTITIYAIALATLCLIRITDKYSAALKVLLVLHVVRLHSAPHVMEFHFICLMKLLEYFIQRCHKELKITLNQGGKKEDLGEIYFMNR